MRGNRYQYALIGLGVVATILFGSFFYDELFPEYRLYQDDFIALEKFRAEQNHTTPPPFSVGIKQIVLEREDKGPGTVDRCISCHVALQIEDYSPTRIARDVNGNIRYDAEGVPLKEENPQYVWAQIDAQIKDLRDEAVLGELRATGKRSVVEARLGEADRLEALKTVHVGEMEYETVKVLGMHPLIGRETRPFEFHPVEEYGCTSCHSGNGRGLVTDRAHGPVFDGQYETEFVGFVPQFTESDPEHDPKFANVFNGKPGHRLLFQTEPILVGGLIESRCINCHRSSQSKLLGGANAADEVLALRAKESGFIQKGFDSDLKAMQALIAMQKALNQEGYEKTLAAWKKKSEDYTLPSKELSAANVQYKFLQNASNKASALEKIQNDLVERLGSEKLVALYTESNDSNKFLEEHFKDVDARGSLFKAYESLKLDLEFNQQAYTLQKSFEDVEDHQLIKTDIDRLTSHYHKGQDLFISQACYACHRIAGHSRGGVGPELSQEGNSYPWFIKQSIVWPQADLKTSTMPNFRLDHEEVEDLVTFLLAQKGHSRAVSAFDTQTAIARWDSGKKMPWEKPVKPSEVRNLEYGMTVFATEGCAACHRMKGYESNVGFAVEKDKPKFEALYSESEWFKKLIPENIMGSQLVKVLKEHGDELDKRIANNVRENSIIEKIMRENPELVESFYTPFKFAARAQDDEKWKQRVNKVLMIFIQEYGFGRLIGPRPSWSGVYRSDEWLMEHFRKPTALIPRSIMPVFPFDDTKFWSLTYMLDVLGKKNRDEVKAVWKNVGFNPNKAYDLFCAQCHGPYLQGNGPVSEWIYPIPKNLRRADFIRNLTRERVIYSIKHGVNGTPMAPWGETHPDKLTKNDEEPVLSDKEIETLADWIFSTVPGGNVIRGEEDVPKWKYSPEDILKELKREGSELKSDESELKKLLSSFHKKEIYYAALAPVPSAESSVSDIFDVVDNKGTGPEKQSYYIKKKYYTSENILAGQRLFWENCAPCHGKEADGAGLRAEVMYDAKPRMLTNLQWIEHRDDLRLLRSIKYGVPGTSMTPWGDFTNSLQRIQMVIFIRSLTEANEKRQLVFNALFNTFDLNAQALEKLRIQEYSKLDDYQKTYDAKKRLRAGLDIEALKGDASLDEAYKSYQSELEAGRKVTQQESVDALMQNLRAENERLKALTQGMGLSLLTLTNPTPLLNLYLDYVQLYKGQFELKDEKLFTTWTAEKSAQAKSFQEKMIKEIDERIGTENKNKLLAQGKIRTASQSNDVNAIGATVQSLVKVKNALISGFSESQRILENQQQIIKDYDNINNSTSQPSSKV